MSNRISTIIAMMCFSIAAFGLYVVKHVVENVQHEVVSLDTELKAESESLHLLNAEWAYLNRPERLQTLASEHLSLVPLDSRQIQDVGVLPAAFEAPDLAADALLHTTGMR